MATTADIRNGLCIEFNGDLWTVVEFQHVKPGKGPAFVRTKLKNLRTGRVLDNTFTSGVKIEVARVERRQYQFSYKDDLGYHFMNQETWEEVQIDESLINAPQFLLEGQTVEIVFHADTETPLSCELPPFVDLTVTYTEPGVKGNTATNTLKDGTVETGANVRIPLFINEGERIRVDTRTGEYSERIKD
ncbi:MAG: elongation factor P [Bacteroidales bacterium]|jgi:elongation factor P|nr:elongation factor P [Bacteroidales bacterium]MBR0122304.1 elongation factor P [Bacteroidales bacterium]MBR5651409.1 elongation factor P [Bacteroidales bacterium]MBR5720045.1 elongation factor P [Bacteroidales bacterium]MBR6491319.1 elongation factor P [Bacteroidales bacterium]